MPSHRGRLVRQAGAWFSCFFAEISGAAGRSLYLGELNLPVLFFGAFKFDINKPTSNINLASTSPCLVAVATGGLPFT
jgi:hypothetical protein